MMRRRGIGGIVVVGSLVVLSAQTTWAQGAQERSAAIKPMAERIQTFADRMPESARRMLSSGALNLINLAERWDRIEQHMRRAQPASRPSGQSIVPPDMREIISDRVLAAPKSVSNTSTDVLSSRFIGFTQSETSTAWCGNNVVVGFNDTGSFIETLFIPIGLSISGVARSTNKGSAFADLGYVNPGPVLTDVLAGDPVLGCSDPNTFYLAALFARAATSDISVSKSTDGGATFGNPISAASKVGTTHFLDKPWMAVDPTGPNRIYVTYTDFDESGAVCGVDAGGPIFRTAIELVRSTDGGISWGPPVVVQEVCGDAFVQGSQVSVGPSGAVYVAWEAFTAIGAREIDIRKSTDYGTTFGAAVKVDNVICVGTCSCFRATFAQLLNSRRWS